jgi:Angiotensin-converting enzyme.
MELAAGLAKEATRFDGLALDAETARKLKLLKLSLVLAAPSDPAKSEALARIAAGMEAAYGRGKWTPPGGEPLSLEEISQRLATSRDPKELAALWAGWHEVGAGLRKDYARYVELGTPARRSSASPTWARCGGASTTCRPTPTRRSSTGSGSR